MSVLDDRSTIPKSAPQEKSLIPEMIKLVAIIVLFLLVIYLFYGNAQYKKEVGIQLDSITEQIKTLENNSQVSEASLSGQIAGLKEEIEGTRSAVTSAKTELGRKLQAERNKTKEDVSQAMAAAALVEEQLQVAKSTAENKITDVNTEVGNVKTDVVSVKTSLEQTQRELEGAQSQLATVQETLGASIAKNATELAQLKLKGARDYYEFTFPKKKATVKIEDIRLILTKTDVKKGKFNMKILVDDGEIERKDLLINEPVQFLVGRNRVRYEVVINWVEKNKAGGYLAVPKDKELSTLGIPVKE